MTHKRLWLLAAVLFPLLPCQSANTGQASQGLTLQLNGYGEVSVPGTATLTTIGTLFQPFTGTVSINYRARTTDSGSASMTLQATSDFSPAGGPSVASGHLTYTCGSASLGASCSGTQVASTASQTPVVSMGGGVCTGGGGACSSTDPNTAQVSFTLPNVPSFKTGTYSASLTFTISAL